MIPLSSLALAAAFLHNVDNLEEPVSGVANGPAAGSILKYGVLSLLGAEREGGAKCLKNFRRFIKTKIKVYSTNLIKHILSFRAPLLSQ